MLFAPIDFKKQTFSAATVADLAKNPSTTTGYNFWGFEVDNTANGAMSYLQIFNKPSSQVTLGTTVPDLVYAVNASSARGFGFGPQLILESGMSGCVTTTKSGNTAPTQPVDVTIYYEAK